MNEIYLLASQSEPGLPAASDFSFDEGGFLMIEDLERHLLVEKPPLPSNVSFAFCLEGVPECEEEFIIKDEKIQASNQTLNFTKVNGELKVYKKEETGNVTYFIGFRVKRGLSIFGEFWGTMIIVAAALVILGLLLVVAAFLVYYYLKKAKPKRRRL